MKRLPIGEQIIISGGSADVKQIIVPNTTTLADVSARVFFSKEDSVFENEKRIAYFSFGKFGMSADVIPVEIIPIPVGDGAVIELETLEQVQSFKFASSQEGFPVTVFVQLFNSIE